MDSVPLNRCTKCGQEFPATIEYFPPRKRNINGLNSECRGCKRAYNRTYDKKIERKEKRNKRTKERRISDPEWLEHKNKLRRERKKERVANDPNYAQHLRNKGNEYTARHRHELDFKNRRCLSVAKYRNKHPESRERDKQRRQERTKNDPQYRAMIYRKGQEWRAKNPHYGIEWNKAHPEQVRASWLKSRAKRNRLFGKSG